MSFLKFIQNIFKKSIDSCNDCGITEDLIKIKGVRNGDMPQLKCKKCLRTYVNNGEMVEIL